MIADQVSAITALSQEQASAADPGAAFFVYFAESVAMSQGQKLLVDALEAHGGSDDEAPSWVNHDLDARILAITFDGLRPRHDSRAGDRSVGAVQADGG